MKPETLKAKLKKVEWHKIEDDFDMPASQGYLINELLGYFVGKCKVYEVGWTMDIVAIKTKKQIIAWKDIGIGARFLGILNEDGSIEQHPDDTRKQSGRPFSNFGKLRREIQKRNYENILGLKANITQEDYMHFLEVLPPLKMGDNWFILSEPLTYNLYYKFVSYPKKSVYLCEVVKLEDEDIEAFEIAR